MLLCVASPLRTKLQGDGGSALHVLSQTTTRPKPLANARTHMFPSFLTTPEQIFICAARLEVDDVCLDKVASLSPAWRAQALPGERQACAASVECNVFILPSGKRGPCLTRINLACQEGIHTRVTHVCCSSLLTNSNIASLKMHSSQREAPFSVGPPDRSRQRGSL